MVKMPMGQKNGFRGDPQLITFVQDKLGIIRRVHDHGFFGALIVNQVAIGAHCSQHTCLNPHITHILTPLLLASICLASIRLGELAPAPRAG